MTSQCRPKVEPRLRSVEAATILERSPLLFKQVNPLAARRIVADVAAEIFPAVLGSGMFRLEEAELPFYDNVKMVKIVDMASASGERHILYGPGLVVLMNWTNEPIYDLNETAPIHLTRRTLIPYTRFFFHYVRGQLGRFLIVEHLDEIPWLAQATEAEKARTEPMLEPVSYRGIDDDGRYTLTATVIFRDALFHTAIKVASREVDILDSDLDIQQHFTVGQMELCDEELLAEQMSVAVDPPPVSPWDSVTQAGLCGGDRSTMVH